MQTEETKTRIGFDLDGTLCDQDNNALSCVELRKDSTLLLEYFRKRKPQMNPMQYASIWDELFTITARPTIAQQITRAWHSTYFPHLKLIFASIEPCGEHDKFLDFAVNMAKAKSTKINELKIEVYFEDVPQVVDQLRKLCPTTKTIQYGGNSQ
jgi:hypothetical protein